MDYEILRNRKVGKITEKVIDIKKHRGRITENDLKNIKKKILEDGRKKYRHFDVSLIKVNAGRWLTFTSDEKYNEYFTNRVRDADKFTEFTNVQFYVHFE